MHGKRTAALAMGLIFVSCGTSHIEGTKVCRRYASAFTQNGRSYQCTFDVRFLTCSSASVNTEWEYSGSSDFVLEPQVPNRILALTRSFSTGGMIVSSSLTQTDYRYDGSGRLLERRRRRNDVSGLRELDVVAYTAWDSFGRPTSGTIRAGDRTGPATIHYDDAARRMDASNGEAVTRDADGNIVREVVVIGFGPPSVVDSIIQGTTEFCL